MNPTDSASFCMAPWVHTFAGPEGNRKLCCVSDDSPRNYESFTEYWNGEFVRAQRRKMLAGEKVNACHLCDSHPHPYREHFNFQFGGLREQVAAFTDASGRYEGLPKSIDYRVNHVCNFKCMMCGPHYSSSWESEVRGMDAADSLPNWLTLNREKTKRYQKEVTSAELRHFVEKGKLVELSWAGGEPLLNPLHWELMRSLVETGQAARVFVRYITNLSQIRYRDESFPKLLSNFERFQVGASLDACGPVGEYLRHGLSWAEFSAHLDELIQICNGKTKRVYIEHRLTLPGLLALPNLVKFVNEKNLWLQTVPLGEVLGDPLHPLSFPQNIVHPIIERVLGEIKAIDQGNATWVIEMLESFLDAEGTADKMPEREFSRIFAPQMRRICAIDMHRYGEHRFLKLFEGEPAVRKFILKVPGVLSEDASASPGG